MFWAYGNELGGYDFELCYEFHLKIPTLVLKKDLIMQHDYTSADKCVTTIRK